MKYYIAPNYMHMAIIKKDTINFLADIRENNNRPWFSSQKNRYVAAQNNVKEFLASLVDLMNKSDSIEKSKLFRIYRDVRFSKDKTPYNAHWSMSMGRTKPYLRGGYFLKLTPDGGVAACGFWNPNPSDLALIRSHIDQDSGVFRKAINNKKLVEVFGDMEGQAVKSAPRGFDIGHADIDLLRHKQFIFTCDYSSKEVLDKGFSSQVVSNFKAIRPFFNHMSDILGHNLNGEPLY